MRSWVVDGGEVEGEDAVERCDGEVCLVDEVGERLGDVEHAEVEGRVVGWRERRETCSVWSA